MRRVDAHKSPPQHFPPRKVPFLPDAGPARGGAGALGTTQGFRHPPANLSEQLIKTPASAMRARLAWGLRPLQRKRVALCRTVRTAPTVQLVERHSPDGQSRLVMRGIQTCGSVHSCPTCAAPILTGRAREVQKALDAHHRDRTALVTLTLRHHRGIPLDVLRTVLARSYSELWAGKGGRRVRNALGLAHHIRAAEQTHGANGWHPHLHAMFFFDRPPPSDWVEQLTARWLQVVAQVHKRLWDATTRVMLMPREERESAETRKRFTRYFGARFCREGAMLTGAKEFRKGLKAMGGVKGLHHSLQQPASCAGIMPDEDHAVVGELISNETAASKYLSKMGLELAGVSGKKAKDGHRTNWQIAEQAAQGDREAQRLFKEHADAMFGARQLTWSRGMRDALGLDPERPDEVLAAEHEPEPGDIDVPLHEIEGAAWDVCAKQRRQLFVAELYEDYAHGLLVRNLEGIPRLARAPVEPVKVWWNRLNDEEFYRDRGAQSMKAAATELASRDRGDVYTPWSERQLEVEEDLHRCREHLASILSAETSSG